MQVPFSYVVVFLFLFLLLAVALLLVTMLLRNFREKQRAYSIFSNYFSDFMITVSQEGILLDARPRFVADPLYEQILHKQSFEQILREDEYNRLQEYIKGLDSYPDIPFVFSFETESKKRWYELRAHLQKRGGDVNMVFFLKNVTHEIEISGQRDQLKENVDMLLRSTGDFLWSLDIDSRRFTFVTPLVDYEGRVIPRSMGVQDLRRLMPEDDYALFEKHLNTRVVDFRATGHDISENRGVRLRMNGEDGSLIWFAFSGRLCTEENAKIVFKGSARRLDLLLENPISLSESVNENALLSLFAFPDVRVFWIDREYKVRGCNQAFSLAFGMSFPKEVEGMRLLEVVRPKYFSLFHGVLSDVFERGLPKAWKGPFGVDKRMLWFNAVPIKHSDGYIHSVLAVYMQLDVDDFNTIHKKNLELL